MSDRSDTMKLVEEARNLGFNIVMLKHGGYGVYAGDKLITRIPMHGRTPHWVRRVRRDLNKAT